MAGRDAERNRQRKREYYAENREQIRAQQAEYYARNRERNLQVQAAWRAANPNYQRDWYQRNRELISARGIAKRHGMLPEDWATLWEAQSGQCYLCGDELDPKRADLDHNHSCCPTMQSCPICRRGLACRNCNSAIGLAGDSPERLRRLADALEAADAAFEQRKAASNTAQLPLFAS